MKKIFKYIKYSIITLVVFYLFFNATAKKLFSRYIERHQLISNLELIKQENSDYKKKLYYLETKPAYMERIVKSELGVIAEDEIEYRFDETPKDDNKKQNEI